jgi:hypothetical protein
MWITRVAPGFVLVTATAVGFGLLLGFAARSQTSSASSQVAPVLKPFSAQINELYYASQGDRPRSDLTRFIARRSDGSVIDRFPTRSPGGEGGEIATITDLRRGIQVTTEPFTKSATTLYLSEAEVASLRAAQDACSDSDIRAAVTSSLSVRGHVLGYEVIRVDLHPRPDWQVSSWVAPALNCLEMRRSDSWTDGAHNEFAVTQLDPREPPDALFDVPAGLTERSPAEAESEYAAKYPGKAYLGSRVAGRLEERYRIHQGNRHN